MSLHVMRFVTREGCELCDEAERRITVAAARFGVQVTIIDADADEHMRVAFGDRLPVVLDGRDRVLAEGRIGGVRATLAAVRVRIPHRLRRGARGI